MAEENQEQNQQQAAGISDAEYANIVAAMDGNTPPEPPAKNDPPAEDPPATDPPQSTDPPAGDPPSNELWKELGDFENAEAFINHYKELSTNSSKLADEKIAWEAKQEELSQAIEEEKGKHKMYTDVPEFAKLAILKNEGVENLGIYGKIALGEEVDSRTLLRMEIAKNIPDLDPKLIDKVIDKKYGLDSKRPEDEDDVQDWEIDQQVKKASMKSDADKILATFKDKLTSVEIPSNTPPSKEEIAIKKVEAQKKWEPHLETLVKSVGDITVEVELDGKKIPVSVGLTSEQTKEFSKVMSDFVHNNAIDFTREELPKVGDTMKRIIESSQKQAVYNALAKKISEERDAYWEAKVNGKGAPAYNTSAAPIDEGSYDAIAKAVDAAYKNS
jgi:hypothetical protein